MSAPDIAWRAVLWSGIAVTATVATAIGAALGLLHHWHEPPGGSESGAASLLPALQSRGPALQSAPQIDAATYRAEKSREMAASEATR